jgi:flagellar biosynthesis protein FlhG
VQQLQSERSAKYHVLVNRVASQNEAWEVFNQFSSLVQEHSDARLRLMGFVPRDESLSAAAMLQRPVALFPDSDPSARTFIRLTDALDRAFARLPAVSIPADSWMRRLRMLTGRPGSSRSPVAPPLGTTAAPGPGTTPETLTLTLDRLRARIADALHDDAEAATVASWIDTIAEAYWDQRGEPPIDLLRAIGRLVAEPGHDAMLSRLRELMGTLNGPAQASDYGIPAGADPRPEPSSGIRESCRQRSRVAGSVSGTRLRSGAAIAQQGIADIGRIGRDSAGLGHGCP